MKHVAEFEQPRQGAGYRPQKAKAADPLPKPERDHCREQLSRLNAKWGAPTTKADMFRVTRLIDMLAEIAESAAHVERIVDRLEHEERFPVGVDIQNAAAETRTRVLEPSPECQTCGGVGWRAEPYSYPWGEGRVIETTRTGKCNCWREVEVKP
jgi:hypothetical protein